PRTADVCRDHREAVVLVRRRQDRLRLRGAHLPPAVGVARLHGLPDPRRSLPRLWLPTADRSGQTEDPRGEPAPPARHGRPRDTGSTRPAAVLTGRPAHPSADPG